jgi:DNA primase
LIYAGRNLDVLSLWGELIDLPSNIGEPLPTFLPKVKCPNPAHETHKAHFQVNTKKSMVHCFARCGISGSYEHAVATILGLVDGKGRPDEKAARRVILKHTRKALGGQGISAFTHGGTRKSIGAEDEVAKDERALKGGQFQFLPKHVRAYLDERGIDAPSRGKWQLGFDEEEERLVIPAFDERGTFRFLIKRKISGGGSLKYLYTRGTTKTSILFGACYLDRDRVRSHGLVLCEGSLDVIRLHQLGITNAVAILGTGLSKKQVRLIDKFGPKKIYLLFDKDSAGVDNVVSAKEQINKCPLFVCRYPKGKDDPAELTSQEVERSLERALPISTFFRKARQRTSTKELVTHG